MERTIKSLYGCEISDDVEMSELKKRLLETEAQMAKILQAMEAVQQKVVSSFDAAGKMVSNSIPS